MKNFRVELKKVVDDSYDVEIGRNLIPQLIKDIKKGLTGNIKKFAVITDSTVERLYATPILVELHRSGFKSDIFVFPAGEKSKVRKRKKSRDIGRSIPALLYPCFYFMILMLFQLYQNVSMKYIHTFSLFHRLL